MKIKYSRKMAYNYFEEVLEMYSNKTYRMQIYSLRMYKHSLKRNKIDLQAIKELSHKLAKK